MRRLTLFLGSLFLLGVIGTWSIGYLLSRPNQIEIGEPPNDLAVEEIFIPTKNEGEISGWYIEGKPEFGGVLLLHSVRSSRLEMIARAKFLNSAGYTILLIDMQAHGETKGDLITFGHLESIDAKLAFSYLKDRVEGRPVGVVGVSLGGAAALLNEPLRADAFVLEAVYSSIEKAVENRIAIRLGEFGRNLAPLLLWQIEPRLGISLEKLSPMSSISKVTVPTMIISGTDDRHTLPEEVTDMFSLLTGPKELWMVEGASHQNLHKYVQSEYEKNVLTFFRKHL